MENALRLISDIDIPAGTQLRVMSILGKARMGKSTFLNAIVSHLKGGNAKPFATQDSDEHCTRGIDYYYCEEERLLLLDCQGLALEDSSHDPALLLFAYLISDIIIFNERMMLQNEALKLMEPICTFMTYIDMDEVKKPILYFRISDASVKDKQKNLDKVMARYKDQYQSIRDSVANLFARIGIVKTDAMDRAAKTRLQSDDYLSLFADESLGFSSAIGELLAALPVGRNAEEWKHSVPQIVNQINNNEKITIDKLDVVGMRAELEVRNWIESLSADYFAPLPADGLQTTYDTHIAPRKLFKQRILSEFTRKFKSVSKEIKEPFYTSLAARLLAPIKAAEEETVAKARSSVAHEFDFVKKDKLVPPVYSTDESITSMKRRGFWKNYIPGFQELASLCSVLYEPVRSECEIWMKVRLDALDELLQKVIAEEAKETEALQAFAEEAFAKFIPDILEHIKTLTTVGRLGRAPESMLFLDPVVFAKASVDMLIEKTQKHMCSLVKPRQISARIQNGHLVSLYSLKGESEEELESVPANPLVFSRGVFSRQRTIISQKQRAARVYLADEPKSNSKLLHDLIKDVYASFVVRMGDKEHISVISTAVTERKRALLFQRYIGRTVSDQIQDVEMVHIHAQEVSGVYTVKTMSSETYRVCFLPFINSVFARMVEKGYLEEGDTNTRAHLVKETTPNTYEIGVVSRTQSVDRSVVEVFRHTYNKMMAKETCKKEGSLYVSPLELPSLP